MPEIMDLRGYFRRWPLFRYFFSLAVVSLALGLQWLIAPVVGPDSYQLALGAVAVAAIFGGTRCALLALLLAAAAKLQFSVLPEISTFAEQGHIVVARMALFCSIGLIICWLGGRLHASEDTLNAVLGNIEDAVIVTDEKGSVRFVNAAAQSLTGWKEPEAAGRSLRQVARFEDTRGGAELAFQLAPREFRPFPAQTFLHTRRGRAVQVEGSAIMVQDTAGERKRLVIVFRDVTERKRAESEREHLIDELQKALAQVKHLSGLLPICASCKKIRDDQGYWHQLEAYIHSHSEAEFSHGICPECAQKLYPELFHDPK